MHHEEWRKKFKIVHVWWYYAMLHYVRLHSPRLNLRRGARAYIFFSSTRRSTLLMLNYFSIRQRTMRVVILCVYANERGKIALVCNLRHIDRARVKLLYTNKCIYNFFATKLMIFAEREWESGEEEKRLVLGKLYSHFMLCCCCCTQLYYSAVFLVISTDIKVVKKFIRLELVVHVSRARSKEEKKKLIHKKVYISEEFFIHKKRKKY